jgi:hypothetical protein
MTDDQLRSIATTLLQTKRFSALSPADLALLREVTGIAEESSESGPRPIAYWMRQNVARLGPLLPLISTGTYSMGMSDLIGAAGGSLPGGHSSSDDHQFFAKVTRQNLLTAVQHVLVNESGFNARTAAYVGGLSGFVECIPQLLEVLASGKVKEVVFGDELLGEVLTALSLLGYPQINDVISEYIGHGSSKVRRRCYLHYECNPDLLTSAPASDWLRKEPDADLWGQCEHIMTRAVNEGVDVVSILLSGGGPFHRKIAEGMIARVLVGGRRYDAIEQVLHDIGAAEMHKQLAIAASWQGDPRLGELFRLPVEEVDTVLYGGPRLVAAASNDPSDTPWLEELFDKESVRQYAILAASGKPSWKDKVAAFRRDHDPKVHTTADLVAGAETPIDRELLERCSLILSLDDKDVKDVAFRLVQARGLALPPIIEDHWIVNGPYDAERAGRFYRAHPLRLFWRIAEGVEGEVFSSNGQRQLRVFSFAAQSDNECFRSFVEALMIGAKDHDVREQLFAVLMSVGGPRTPLGRSFERFIMNDRSADLRSEPGGQEGMLLLAMVGQEQQRAEAVTRIFGLREFDGTRAESSVPVDLNYLLPYFLAPQVGGDIATQTAMAVAQMPEVPDPYLAEVAKLIRDEVGSLKDLQFLERHVFSPVAVIRHRLMMLLVSGGEIPDGHLSTFFHLLYTTDESVRRAGINFLAKSSRQFPWAQRCLMDLCRIDEMAEDAVTAMAASGNVEGLSPIVQAVIEAEDPKIQGIGCTAINKMMKEHPTVGLFAATVAVNDWFERNLGGEEASFSLNDQERRMEALKSALSAVTKLTNAELANLRVGTKVLLSPLTEWNPNESIAQSLLTSDELLGIMAFLKVVYVDEQTGAILTEVSDSITGQVVNALFEGRDTVVIRASWS